jgi:hypothetical protein
MLRINKNKVYVANKIELRKYNNIHGNWIRDYTYYGGKAKAISRYLVILENTLGEV